MANILRTNGVIESILPENNKVFRLKELQEIVGGRIEIIILFHIDAFMVINEEGKILDLPVNEEATKIYHALVNPNDYIVGDCLICKTSQIL